MKKIVLLSDSEREAFLNYCEAIKNMESDKDKFLEASRLSRNESKLSGEQIYWVKLAGIWSKIVALFVIGVFMCLFFRGCA